MIRVFNFLQRDEALPDLFMQFFVCTPRSEEELEKYFEADNEKEKKKYRRVLGSGKE